MKDLRESIKEAMDTMSVGELSDAFNCYLEEFSPYSDYCHTYCYDEFHLLLCHVDYHQAQSVIDMVKASEDLNGYSMDDEWFALLNEDSAPSPDALLVSGDEAWLLQLIKKHEGFVDAIVDELDSFGSDTFYKILAEREEVDDGSEEERILDDIYKAIHHCYMEHSLPIYDYKRSDVYLAELGNSERCMKLTKGNSTYILSVMKAVKE